MELTQTQIDSCIGLVLEDDLYRLLILPQVGGKMASLVYRPTGVEFIWRNPDRPFRPPQYGAPFGAYDISGFDECFPNIAEGPYPDDPWKGTPLADHGEMWCTPWEWEWSAGRLHLWNYGVRLPYRLDKWLSRAGRSVQLDYQLTNLSPFRFRYIWSAHPLFAARPGMRILLPEGIKVRVDSSIAGRLGPLCTEHPWPHTRDTAGRAVDLSRVQSGAEGWGDKLYTTRLSQGYCALWHPPSGDFVGFTFAPEQVPYVGVWINQGGWPAEDKPCFNVALEPCLGYPDRLDIAALREEIASVAAKGTQQWRVKLQAGRATEVLAALDPLA